MLDVLLNDVTINQTLVKVGFIACFAVCAMDLADMAYPHLSLGILLMYLMGLNGAPRFCPAPCHCSLDILNCSRITSPPRFHQVPLPKPAVHLHPFMYLDFTGNAISSIGKEVWNAYPWAEYVLLKSNSLSRLQNSSLEGLLSLTYLDLSYNKIQLIEKNAFEAVPFLQIINLSGNRIEKITEGTFWAWHGMQFLVKVDLSHNPLVVIQDSYFYRLPLLNLLDLSATRVMPRILEDLLKSSLQLKMLILPKKTSCCLCHMKEDTEVLHKTVSLECTEPCDINATLCEKEELLNKLKEELMKLLEIRKWNSSNLLSILPERALSNNDKPERTKLGHDNQALVKNYSSLADNLNLLKSVERLMQMKADEPLDKNWADKSGMKNLYLLASLLQAAFKEKTGELDKVSPEVAVRNELTDQVLEKQTDESRKRSTYTSLKKERHESKVTNENSLGRNQRLKDTLFRLGRDGQEVAEAAMQSADEPSIFESHNKAESWRKLAEGLEPQLILPFLYSQQEILKSSWKHSISDSATNTVKFTGSLEVDSDAKDLPSVSTAGNSMEVQKKGLEIQILTKEEFLDPLLHRSNHLAGDGKPVISAGDSGPSLNELSPDIALSHGTYWKHQKTPVFLPLGFARLDDYLLQGDLLETKLNKKLTSLVPKTPVRKLISHVIHILKMDCTSLTVQMPCAKLIFRTRCLIKLLSENDNKTSSQRKLYFWPPMNVANMTKASSKRLEKPLVRIAFWIFSSSVLIFIVFFLYTFWPQCCIGCFFEMCSQCCKKCCMKIWCLWSSVASFLSRRKRPLPDEELSRAPSSLSDYKPLQFKDTLYIQDEIQRNNKVVRLHEEQSLEDMSMVSCGNARPSLPESATKQLLSVPMLKLLILPLPILPPPPPPSLLPPSSSFSNTNTTTIIFYSFSKVQSEKSSDAAGEISEAISSKVVSSATDEGEEKDQENLTTAMAMSEEPESREGPEEDKESE